MIHTKKELRQQFKYASSLLSIEQRALYDKQIQLHLDQLLHQLCMTNLIVYIPSGYEPNIDVSIFFKRYTTLFCPKSIDNSYSFVELNSLDMLVKGKYGILEPSTSKRIPAEILTSKTTGVLVPGVGFDLNKNRLGHGKGIYDRLLTNFNGPCIGICYSNQITENIPIDTFDYSMDYLITNTFMI